MLSGCATNPYGNEAISIGALEGVWEGYADSQLATTRVTCTIRMPITFKVKDGRAISLCNDPRCLFNVALKENGGIKFIYKKAIAFEEGGTGVISQRNIHFEGQLSTSDLGKGTFSVSGCVGKWQVTRQSTFVPEAKPGDLPSRVQSEFNNYLSDPKYIDFKSFSVNPSTGRWGKSWASVSPELAAIRAKAICSISSPDRAL